MSKNIRSFLIFVPITLVCVVFIIRANISNTDRHDVALEIRYRDKLPESVDPDVGGVGQSLSPLPDLLLQPAACATDRQQRVAAVVAVMSRPSNRESRKAIRETWGSEMALSLIVGLDATRNGSRNSSSDVVRLVFVLATGAGHLTEVLKENAVHGDILLGDFPDCYANLPLKVYVALGWFKNSCQNADYLLKIDDDVFLNPHLLRSKVITKIKDPRGEAIIYGRAWTKHTPVRQWGSKWYVTYQQYPAEVYPVCVSGTVYVLTAPAVLALHEAAPRYRLMPMENVFFTGVVADAMGIPVVGVGQQMHDDSENIGLGSARQRCAAVNSFVAVHGLTPHGVRELWTLLKNDNVTTCTGHTWSDDDWSLGDTPVGRINRTVHLS